MKQKEIGMNNQHINNSFVNSPSYDLAGLSIGRVIKTWLLWAAAPYGKMEHGPSAKELTILFLHHKIGFAWIKIKTKFNK